jgi:hypothetical protein
VPAHKLEKVSLQEVPGSTVLTIPDCMYAPIRHVKRIKLCKISCSAPNLPSDDFNMRNGMKRACMASLHSVTSPEKYCMPSVYRLSFARHFAELISGIGTRLTAEPAEHVHNQG